MQELIAELVQYSHVHVCHCARQRKTQEKPSMWCIRFSWKTRKSHVQHFDSLIFKCYFLFYHIFFKWKYFFAKDGTWNKSQNSKNVVQMTSLANQENSFAHITFCFFIFTIIVWVWTSWKHAERWSSISFSRKVNFAKMEHTCMTILPWPCEMSD